MSREVAKVSRYDRSMADAFERFRQVIWPSSRTRASSPAERADESRQAKQILPRTLPRSYL